MEKTFRIIIAAVTLALLIAAAPSFAYGGKTAGSASTDPVTPFDVENGEAMRSDTTHNGRPDGIRGFHVAGDAGILKDSRRREAEGTLEEIYDKHRFNVVVYFDSSIEDASNLATELLGSWHLAGEAGDEAYVLVIADTRAAKAHVFCENTEKLGAEAGKIKAAFEKVASEPARKHEWGKLTGQVADAAGDIAEDPKMASAIASGSLAVSKMPLWAIWVLGGFTLIAVIIVFASPARTPREPEDPPQRFSGEEI